MQGCLLLALTVGALCVMTLTRIGPHLVMMAVPTILSAFGNLFASGTADSYPELAD